MDQEQLAASLDHGDAWVAHGNGPGEDTRQVGITVTLMKLGNGQFQVGIDTYFIEGVYGTDISWDHHRFAVLSEALDFIEAETNISRDSLKQKQ
jgi:hypothetical protein